MGYLNWQVWDHLDRLDRRAGIKPIRRGQEQFRRNLLMLSMISLLQAVAQYIEGQSSWWPFLAIALLAASGVLIDWARTRDRGASQGE